MDAGDVREFFKCMRAQRIGVDMAVFYVAWARFEWECDRHEKAQAVVSQGVRAGAEPRSILEDLRRELGLEATDRTGQTDFIARHLCSDDDGTSSHTLEETKAPEAISSQGETQQAADSGDNAIGSSMTGSRGLFSSPSLESSIVKERSSCLSALEEKKQSMAGNLSQESAPVPTGLPPKPTDGGGEPSSTGTFRSRFLNRRGGRSREPCT